MEGNFKERWELFLKATEEAKRSRPGASIVTPMTARILTERYGDDVLQMAIEEKIITEIG